MFSVGVDVASFADMGDCKRHMLPPYYPECSTLFNRKPACLFLVSSWIFTAAVECKAHKALLLKKPSERRDPLDFPHWILSSNPSSGLGRRDREGLRVADFGCSER